MKELSEIVKANDEQVAERAIAKGQDYKCPACELGVTLHLDKKYNIAYTCPWCDAVLKEA